MLRTLQISKKEDEVFFISDFHHHHDRDFIWGKRGFNDIGTSDETLIDRWNETVSGTDTVFHLGDFIFRDSDGSRFRQLIRRLNFGHLYLLWGNHTSGQRQVYFETLKAQYGIDIGGPEVYPLATEISGKSVTFLPALVNVQVSGQPIVLCHYPIRSHEGIGKGYWHLCGHSHGSCAMSNKNTGEGFILDVGVESFGRPIPMKEVRRHFKNRTPVSVDHH